MDPTNDEPVAIYYQVLGGRELAVVEDAAASRAREAQANGPWLNPFMCPVIRGGSTLPPAMSLAQAYVIAPGTSCWDSPPWSPVGGMYDSRQTYLMHFKPVSVAEPMLTCCQQSGNSPCPAQYIRCGGAWEATLSLPGVSASATPTPSGTPSTTPSAAAAGASASSTPAAAAASGTDTPTPSATTAAAAASAAPAASFTAFVTPSVAPSKAPISPPIADGGFRCMNRGSEPPYAWTNFDVRAVGGALTVTIDDGSPGSASRTWCWNMDPANDEVVDIYYTALGGRALAAVEQGAHEARQAQAMGQWLNPHMVRFFPYGHPPPRPPFPLHSRTTHTHTAPPTPPSLPHSAPSSTLALPPTLPPRWRARTPLPRA
jgi:hypothetical protein